MAKMLDWNTDEFFNECVRGSMERLETCAKLIRENAKHRLIGRVRETWKQHGVYKTGAYAEQYWTERRWGELAATIRVVKKFDVNATGRGFPIGGGGRNLWIMAGNKKVWWAVQTEYGHGGWRGGAKPFLRPAFEAASSICAGVMENG